MKQEKVPKKGRRCAELCDLATSLENENKQLKETKWFKEWDTCMSDYKSSTDALEAKVKQLEGENEYLKNQNVLKSIRIEDLEDKIAELKRGGKNE